MLLSSNKRERHTPGHRRLPDGFDRAGPGWSLNLRFAGQYCSVWQNQRTCPRFQDAGNHRRIGLLDPWQPDGVVQKASDGQRGLRP